MAKFKVPAMLPLCLAIMVGQKAAALGLGPATLDSELGEPLFARIPIFKAEGLGSEQLLVSLVAVKDGDSGIEIGSVDTRSISAVGEVDLTGNGTIYLRSDRPLREPFLHFMLNVRWPNGSLSRAYTLLFDPPVDAVAKSTAGVTVLQNIDRTASTAIVSKLPNAPRQAPVVAESIVSDSAFYTTVRGDSLWSIALRLARAKSGSVALWMDRLYANNPKAFIRGNRNLLKERVTLDLFESLPEPLDTEPVTSSPAKPAKNIKAVATGSLGRPNGGLGLDPAIVSRREEEGGGNTASSAGEGDGVLSEKQFLQQNLGEVEGEVARVSENIAQMSQRLVALQAQLDSLNSQYQQMRSAEVAGAVPALVQSELVASPTGIEAVGGDNAIDPSASEADLALTADFASEQATAPDTGTAPGTAPGSNNVNVMNNTAVTLGANAMWQWLLPLVAVGLAVLLWLRRRTTAPRIEPVDLSDVNAAVAARKDTFNDVFTSLDSQASVVRKPNGDAQIGAPENRVNDELDAFDTANAVHEESKFEMPPLSLDEELLSAINNPAFDETEEDEEIAELQTDDLFAEAEAGAELDNEADQIDIDEIELDDTIFSAIDEEPKTPSVEPEFGEFDLSDIDDEWLSGGSDAPDLAVMASNDASHRAAAAMELGDYTSAKHILETEISVSDDVELKMQLLDVYAHSGDTEEFEALALQLEFSNGDDEKMREVDILRGILTNSHVGTDKRHAD
ncbi:FimV family protein [Zhongshania guokunii]|uniref:FimV family protein n=1 Tax=Zhongshania guokunii TaxID=641783 RepID=A0ABV3UBG2_9GAMM